MLSSKEIYDYITNVGSSRRGIDNFTKFLEEIGNPHKELKVIHIVGTNGKGSTTMFLQSLLQCRYDKVSTFTSPSIIDIYDRIRINNKFISEEDFNKIFNDIYDLCVRYQLGFFQILTAITFIYFKEQNVDIAVIEAGIGGKNDGTSVVNSEVRLLTTVDQDHTNILGNDIYDICTEKIGALKPKEHLITTVCDKSLRSVIEEFCSTNDNTVEFVCMKTKFDVALVGDFQKYNANLAIECCKYLGLDLSEEEIKSALLAVKWPGRFERITDSFYIDGAHNKQGLRNAVKTANKVFGKNNYKIIFSCLRDKNIQYLYNIIYEYNPNIVVTTFNYHRAYNERELSRYNYEIELDFRKLVDEAYVSDTNYLLVGSLYFICDVIKYLQTKGVYNAY